LALGFAEFDTEMALQGYIGALVLPVVDVAEEFGTYGVQPIEEAKRNVNIARASGGEYAGGRLRYEPRTYATKEYGYTVEVDRRNAKLYGSFLAAEQMAAGLARDVLLTEYEKRVAAAVFNATTWTGASLTTGVTNEWDDFVNADPVGDVGAAMGVLFANSGLIANTVIVNWKVYNNMRRCAKLVEYIKYNGLLDARVGNITGAVIAQALGVAQLLVAGAVKNTAAEGAAKALSSVWSDEYAMVAYIDPRRDGNMARATLGRTIHWTGDGSLIGGMIDEYASESRRADFVRARHDVYEDVAYVEAGHLLSNITT
jgi:hypothetical protein